MCGRFAMSGDLDFYAQYYGVDDVATEPVAQSWNVAPTDESYVVAVHDGRRALGRMRWGLVPHWAEDARTIHINARAETIADKAAFKRDFLRHRCLVPADGFYEWEPPDRGRTPHWVYRADGHPMSFAGIWGSWRDPATGEWQRRFSIVTTGARGAIRSVHDRMPVVLPADVWEPWLDRSLDDAETLLGLLRTIDEDLIMEHTVSSRVNSVRNNGPDLREPIRETLF